MANPGPKRGGGGADLAPEAQLGMFLRTVIHEEIGAALDERIPGYLASLRMPARPAGAVESVYITREQAAEITGYSLRTINRRIATAELAAYGARKDRIRRSDIDLMMARRPKRATALSDEDEASREVDRIMGEDQ